MTATSDPTAGGAAATAAAPGVDGVLDRAGGIELLGPVQGSGYRDGAALVRRADGQVVQLGPLMYGLLECLDGRRTGPELAAAVSARLGRRLGEEHVRALAGKLAALGLLAGTEQAAPPRRNPLLALRWKVLVTDPVLTRRLTAPVAVLFRPWLLWPLLAAFAAVCWFVLAEKGVAAATAEAFDSPGLLLLVFALAVVSAGVHELGHAAACRYGGATPGGMGVGLYLVWPAFYTDVTDAYRLDRRSRLRVDLAGLYLNAVVAVVTTAVWLLVRRDALLLLVALQLLQMVKQLSPVIRADGYHILADLTGVPDLYAHLGPTLRRLLPGHRSEPSALTGRARLVVTAWVLVVVPVLLSLVVGAVLLLPRLITTAWGSGRGVVTALPHLAGDGDVLGVLAALLRLVALVLPVVGSLLVAQKLLRTSTAKARAWSAGRPGRRAVAIAAAVAVAAGLAWAWWPSGQYHPVRAADRGTLPSLVQLLGHPRTAVRASAGPAPRAARPAAQPATVLPPGTHLVLAAVPRGGATAEHPALLVLPGASGRPPAAVAVPDSSGTGPLTGVAFPFRLPAAPGPGDTQALATGTRDGGVVYTISYALVTVPDGAPVTQTNSAFALARCTGCTTVAVSFQVVLVVGTSHAVAPIDAAGALDVDCPACVTTAIAEQMVVTVARQPSAELEQQLRAALSRLGALPQLGAEGSPQAVLAAVQAVQQQVATVLAQSGLTVGAGATPSAATATAGAGTTAATTSSPDGEPSVSATPSRTPTASTTAAESTTEEASPTGTAAATTSSP